MNRLFPIFVLLCIAFVVIGSRASRPAASVAAPASAEAKSVESGSAQSLRQATAHAAH